MAAEADVSRSVFDATGDDHGRFVMDNRTGEIRLTRAVDDHRPAANFTLTVMVTASSLLTATVSSV